MKKLFLNDRFILSLIIINSVILFIGGYSYNKNNQFILLVIDNLITTLFILELIFKIIQYGAIGYFKSNWNKFDFALIVLSVPALITFIFNLSLIDFSFLLIFRVVRVFKVFRFFKFIPNVGDLIQGVQRALKASIFVFIGFIISLIVSAFTKNTNPELSV